MSASIGAVTEPCSICNEAHPPVEHPPLSLDDLTLLRAQAACPMVCAGFSPTTVGQLLRMADANAAAHCVCVARAEGLEDVIAEARAKVREYIYTPATIGDRRIESTRARIDELETWLMDWAEGRR